MATIRKRENSYQIDYFDPHGKRVRKSFAKRKEAEAELGKRVSLIAEGRYLDVKRECTTTFGELLKEYEENYKDQASYKTGKRFFVDVLRDCFGKETLLSNIRYMDLETFRNSYQKMLTKAGKFRTVATVNRMMSCLRHIFSKAIEWEMVERSPFNKGKSLILKENNMRLRYLNEEEIDGLLDACSTKIIEFPNNKKRVKRMSRKDEHYLKDIVETGLNTGMRKGEILSLKWDQIRNGFIYLTKTKTNEARQIPVNETLEAVFANIRKRSQLKCQHVFTFQGKEVHDIKNSFNAAVKRAGLEDFHFHDLRHTFASQLIMRGGSLKEVQELLGHKTMTMTLRYAHLSQEHIRGAVNLLNGLTSSSKKAMCHKTVTFTKTENRAIL